MKKLGFICVVFLGFLVMVESKCSTGCDLGLASYYLWQGASLSLISEYLNTDSSEILKYNTYSYITNSIAMGTRLNVPFSCDCLNGEYLGHNFSYTIDSGDNYAEISQTTYSNLTTPSWIQKFNNYEPTNLPVGGNLNVIVNCSCGDTSVSPDYGLFITFPLRPGNNLNSVAELMNMSASLLQRFNPDADFSAGAGLVYIPVKDQTANHSPPTPGPSTAPSEPSTSGLSRGVIIGICVAVVAGLTILSVCLYLAFIKGKKEKEVVHSDKLEFELLRTDISGQPGGSAVSPGITIDKSVEFSYEELASATDNFSLAKKIGQGGFGAVYYAELRGEKAAIKKMDMQATREFLAELKVLTHVHHLNLVRLIGYCVEASLFLVYEYIENGTLGQHLQGSDRAPLPWSTRVQIALDSARGLEYIHEHTVPVYIHRDIKTANILIDNNFHAKVADFGLAKLSEVRKSSKPTPRVGTFGYMPPEYAKSGDISVKVDVYAFGVVLYQLISAKEAVVKESGYYSSLVNPFALAHTQLDPNAIRKLIDPRLGDDYPIDSVLKFAELAKACTQVNPDLRPTMRSVVVDLIYLSSMSDGWNISPSSDHGLLEYSVWKKR